MRQVSAAIITILLLTVFLIYLKRRTDSLTTANVCPAQNLSSTPTTNVHKNGLIGTSGTNRCCDAVYGKTLEQVCGRSYRDNKRPLQTAIDPSFVCTCMDYFRCKLVVVSAVSSNHMSEATEMILSVQKYMPYTLLIMYSLGLTDKEMVLLRSYCDLELRIFNFDKYPALSYTKHNLRKYGWKPLIVDEVAKEYELILWFDASIRLTRPIDDNVFKYLLSSPAFLAGPWEGKMCLNSNDPIVSYTHDQTLRYLFPDKSQNIPALRKELQVWGHIQACVWLMWLNKDTRQRILDNWVDCAFHEECMAPREAVVDCNPIKRGLIGRFSPNGEYIGCHRYDQSVLDMILYREFGPSSAENICQDFVFDLFLILRDSQTEKLFKIFVVIVAVLIGIIIFINWCFS